MGWVRTRQGFTVEPTNLGHLHLLDRLNGCPPRFYELKRSSGLLDLLPFGWHNRTFSKTRPSKWKSSLFRRPNPLWKVIYLIGMTLRSLPSPDSFKQNFRSYSTVGDESYLVLQRVLRDPFFVRQDYSLCRVIGIMWQGKRIKWGRLGWDLPGFIVDLSSMFLHLTSFTLLRRI